MPRYLTPRRLDVALVVVLGITTLYFARTGFNTDTTSGDVPFPIGPLPAFPPPGPLSFSQALPDMLGNLAAVLLLLGRRRWPIPVFVIQFGMLLAFDIESNPASLLAVIIAAYSVAAFSPKLWQSLGTLLVACLAMVAVKDNTWPSLPDWSGVFVILLPVGLIGAAVQAGRERVRASTERAEASTRLAVAQERSRIARELHDVVSHHVSVMTIQAGAAGKVLDAQPELAREALTAIESSGRETMAELRHLLGLLAPGPGDEMLHPQPGLEQLDQLIATVRQAGLPVTSHRTPVNLPRGLDLTAYRVVQEALTNALRYAPGAATDVAVTADTADLVIEVVNDAPPPGTTVPSAEAGAGSGTGLLGLTERLKLYGGTLETGRRRGGGFRVLARLPLAAAT